MWSYIIYVRSYIRIFVIRSMYFDKYLFISLTNPTVSHSPWRKFEEIRTLPRRLESSDLSITWAVCEKLYFDAYLNNQNVYLKIIPCNLNRTYGASPVPITKALTISHPSIHLKISNVNVISLIWNVIVQYYSLDKCFMYASKYTFS